MKPRAVVSLFLAALLSSCAARGTPATAAPLPWDDAQQLVLVLVPDWDSNTGTLQRYGREGDGWKAIGAAAEITVGRAGVAWGIGLHPRQADGPQGAPVKREGDGRAPAGVFALGDAFGYAADADTRLPYLALGESQYCIDVDGSPLYNRIVDAKDVGAGAVKDSTEPMRRDLHANGDQRYREGFVIRHNPRNVSGMGSCIFAHLWKAPGEPTAGCTAMAPATMEALLAWLDPARKPVFVLLPQAEHERLKAAWRLP
ncbi:hypothetical protein GCM10027084_25610 [Pseudoxanthomonas sangjuensis]|uniref:L,D-transpeptidase family protein n=1 Tax=Pseudoxanthomonas sangjuensis TaxID=1503750 RepID=UPI001391BA69|nr:hypothetical protein [Pseudoxanthomonas sangjuensis]KAF1714298.1 hypothetical protein CSC71_04490 [Pseudoxanthomonas sangjuensis]